MAKGDITLVKCIGSVGAVVRDFNTKDVIAGSFRHTQTINGVEYSWKCGALHLTGVVKLVACEFVDAAGETKSFFRMEGMAAEVSAVTKVNHTFAALTDVEW